MRFPSIPNFVAALFGSAREWVDTGSVVVPERIEDERTRICEGCDDFDSRCRQCQVCTCLVDVKVLLKAESCPKNKWGRWGRAMKRLLDND
jgi:hypothetical protein